MRLPELFSGTGLLGSAFASGGCEVVNLDSDTNTDATIHEDNLNWDRTADHFGHFDAIWAGPCCAR